MTDITKKAAEFLAVMRDLQTGTLKTIARLISDELDRRRLEDTLDNISVEELNEDQS